MVNVTMRSVSLRCGVCAPLCGVRRACLVGAWRGAWWRLGLCGGRRCCAVLLRGRAQHHRRRCSCHRLRCRLRACACHCGHAPSGSWGCVHARGGRGCAGRRCRSGYPCLPTCARHTAVSERYRQQHTAVRSLQTVWTDSTCGSMPAPQKNTGIASSQLKSQTLKNARRVTGKCTQRCRVTWPPFREQKPTEALCTQ